MFPFYTVLHSFLSPPVSLFSVAVPYGKWSQCLDYWCPLHLAPEEPKHAARSDVHNYLTTLCRISLACHSVYSTPTPLF